MATAATMCKPHASEARRPEAGSRAVGVRDVEGWPMPVPSGMSEQRTWSSAVRETETQACVSFIIYLCYGLLSAISSSSSASKPNGNRTFFVEAAKLIRSAH